MDLSAPKTRVARFGLFEADFERRVLTKSGTRVRLQDQPFQVLALLLERPYEIVSREEIQQRLWPADTFVAFDDGLNTAIKKLRLALGDSADNPRFIETVPRRGYRFLAAPSFVEGKASEQAAERGSAEQAAEESGRSEPVPAVDAARAGIQAWRVAGLLCIAGLLVAGVVITGKEIATRRASGRNAGAIPAVEAGRISQRELNLQARDEYLQAKKFWKLRTAEALAQAVDHFNLAIEHDPGYAAAYAGLANCYVVMPMLSTVPADDSYQKARQAAEKALALDASVAEAHLAAAEVKLYLDWNFPGAEIEFRQALELDSNDAQAHQWYAEFLSLMGRHREAISEIQVAQHLDPISMIIHHQAGQIYQNARMYREAFMEYRRALMIEPGFGPTYAAMMVAFRRVGRYPECVEAERQADRYWDPGGASAADLKRVADASVRGKQAYLRAALEFNKKHPSTAYNAALDYVQLGENDQALHWLQISLEARQPQIINLLNDPEFDHIRGDARFQEIVKKVGLKAPGTETHQSKKSA
jgi:DNA-binding winged helix-turn-helix (wHTH) protein/Tfp pilus assembly protein PilF